MILSIDVGTSGLKGGVFDREGRLLFQDSFPVSLLKKGKPQFYEIEPQDWINALKRVCRSLSEQGGRNVEAIVVSGNGPTLVAVDKGGTPLYPAISWIDTRGVEAVKEAIGHAETGADPAFYLSKVYWFFREKTDLYKRTMAFLPCPEYIAYYLSGNLTAILPSPRYGRYLWTAAAIDLLGMDAAKFPPFVKTGEIVGALRKTTAAELGLKEGIAVVAGGPDFLMSLIGTATVVPGTTCDRAGSSEGINHCSERPVEDKRLLCLPHIVEGYENISGVISTTGKALEWYREAAGYNQSDYQGLFDDIAAAEAGAGRLIFLPYLAGERSPVWDPYARGSFVGLTLRHTRREMARAVAESIGYAIRHIIEVIEENGFQIGSMRVAGSQAKSHVLNQIKADITGRSIQVPVVSDSELMGDACVGLVFLGEFGSFVEASRECVKIETEYTPRRENYRLYSDMFRLYTSLYPQLKSVFSELWNMERGQ